MSNWFVAAALLCLFCRSQATVSECEEVTKPLDVNDDYKSIMGEWIFLEGISDHHFYTSILKTVTSAWIVFAPSSHEDTVTLSEAIMLGGKCAYQTINMTIEDSTGYFIENDASREGRLLPSCHNCLTISMNDTVENETMKSLYFFTRKGFQNETDLALYWKQAQCLGFRREPKYSYDGVSDLCYLEETDQKNVDKLG